MYLQNAYTNIFYVIFDAIIIIGMLFKYLYYCHNNKLIRNKNIIIFFRTFDGIDHCRKVQQSVNIMYEVN